MRKGDLGAAKAEEAEQRWLNKKVVKDFRVGDMLQLEVMDRFRPRALTIPVRVSKIKTIETVYPTKLVVYFFEGINGEEYSTDNLYRPSEGRSITDEEWEAEKALWAMKK
jgi:hypothetical protein